MIEHCLQSIQLKNFRCFESVTLNFDGPLVLIQGINGSGKTSILEALHYACYLKSFRTHSPRDLIRFGQKGFFIKTTFNNQEVSIGCTGSKRHVKVNQKVIASYKELRNFYRIVTVTEDDVDLVRESPEKRRSFVDHALLLHNPELMSLFKEYKHVVESRNALLNRQHINGDDLEVWTKTLWEHAQKIKEERVAYLEGLQKTIDTYLSGYWQGDYSLVLSYAPKKIDHNLSWEGFLSFWNKELKKNEYIYRRSLFGTHLDDIKILFQGKAARLFSSRGQQKLIVMLIKIAQVQHLMKEQGATCFLLDDFMTDFDEKTIQKLVEACKNLKTQLIFTSPVTNGVDGTILKKQGALTLNVSI